MTSEYLTSTTMTKETLIQLIIQYQSCTNFVHMAQNSTEKLYPISFSVKICTAILLTNLAEPNMVNVNCNDKLLPYVACMASVKQNKMLNYHSQHTEHCPAETLFLDRKCLHFQWVESQRKLAKLLLKEQNLILSLKSLHNIGILTDSVQGQFPPVFVLSMENRSKVIMVSCQKLHCKKACTNDPISTSHVSGFAILPVPLADIFTGGLTLKCKTGVHVNVMVICDGQVDCAQDKSDEMDCHYSNSVLLNQSNIPRRFLFFVTVEGDHVLFGSKPSINTLGDFLKVSCTDSPILFFQNDLVVDCSPSEEQNLIELLSGIPAHCETPSQLPCQEGHTKCFNVSNICMYMFNMYNHLHPCRNGGHLENCYDFQCVRSFKCTTSYCIPWTYVCDGKVDCPTADDENVFNMCQKVKRKCTGKYKCSRTSQCILLVSLCDGLPDCPIKDDEFLCQLKHLSCPTDCNCLALAIKCTKHKGLLKAYPFLSIFLSRSPTVHKYSTKFQETLFLWIQDSNVTQIVEITLPETLLFLDMADNIIDSIPGESFHQNPKLRSLGLENNNITKISEGPFVHLTDLRRINLSSNPIMEFLTSDLPSTMSLLSVLDTIFEYIDTSTFKLAMPQVVQVSDYHICCFVPQNTHCTAHIPWFRSCGDLLEDMTSKVGSYLLSTLLLVANILSICVHIWNKKTFNKAYLAAVLSGNIHNLSLAVYFITLWANDLMLKGMYVEYDYQWRRGSTCFVAAGMHLQFVLSSQLLSTFVSLCRLMVVIHPITTQFKRLKPVSKYLVFVSLVSIIFVVSTVVMIFITGPEIPDKFCTIFHDPTKKLVSVQTAIWGSFITHLVSMTTICLMHITIIHKSKESHKIITVTKACQDSGLQVQLALISASIILSWTCYNIIILTALHLQSYPMALFSSVLVFVQPIYPTLNPVVLSGFVLKSTAKGK